MFLFNLRLKSCCFASLLAVLVIMPTISSAQERTPIEKFANGFPLELAESTHAADLPKLLAGGDEAVYFASRASEFFPTTILPVRQPVMRLKQNLIPEIGEITAKTQSFGELSLIKFLATPESYSQGMIVVHGGKIVYEQYPRMRPEDHHLWMSNAKVTASLVIDLLINDGKIDENKTFESYVPEFRGTPTGKVRVKDVLDMTTGLNSDENPETRSNPDSIATRIFLAEFGMPHEGKIERLIDVLKEAEFECNPGKKFQYASATTQLLVFLAEAVENKRWSDIFDERVWSKIGALAPIQLHTTPDGIVAAHTHSDSKKRSSSFRVALLFAAVDVKR